MTNVNIIFTISAPSITDSAAFEAFGQWVLLNERDGRLLFDAVCPEDNVALVFHTLTQMGKQPMIVGGWIEDGSPLSLYPLVVDEWIRTAPDVMDYTDPNTPAVIRPSDFQEIHGWAGWQSKQKSKHSSNQLSD